MTAARIPTIAVVGGGITGLAAARRIRLAGTARAVLLEAGDRLGGLIRTQLLDGASVEAAPDAFVVRDPEPLELCRSVGLGDRLVRPAVFGAAVWKGGRLHRLPRTVFGVPASVGGVLSTELLSAAGRVRALGDLVLPGPLEGPDVSIGCLVRRRFGRDVLDSIVDPWLGGTRAGQVDDVSLGAAAPELDRVARSSRSVMRGIARARRDGPVDPEFRSVRGGLGTLVRALAEQLADIEIALGAAVETIELAPDRRYALRTTDGRTVIADGAVVATPAFAAAAMLERLSPGAARQLAGIRYAPVAVVTLVYPPGAEAPARSDGLRDVSGVLVPSNEGRTVTALTFFSEKWPQAAPAEAGAVMRAFVGRSVRDRTLERDDEELSQAVQRDVQEMLGIRARPRCVDVVRYERGLPQYEVGHLERVDATERALQRFPGIALAGAGYRGPGIPACIAQAHAAAQRVLGSLAVDATEGT